MAVTWQQQQLVYKRGRPTSADNSHATLDTTRST